MHVGICAICAAIAAICAVRRREADAAPEASPRPKEHRRGGASFFARRVYAGMVVAHTLHAMTSDKPDATRPPPLPDQTEVAPVAAPPESDQPLDSSQLGSGALAQQPTDSQPVAVLKVCPQCGTEYETAARFCPADGTALR